MRSDIVGFDCKGFNVENGDLDVVVRLIESEFDWKFVEVFDLNDRLLLK